MSNSDGRDFNGEKADVKLYGLLKWKDSIGEKEFWRIEILKFGSYMWREEDRTRRGGAQAGQSRHYADSSQIKAVHLRGPSLRGLKNPCPDFKANSHAINNRSCSPGGDLMVKSFRWEMVWPVTEIWVWPPLCPQSFCRRKSRRVLSRGKARLQ